MSTGGLQERSQIGKIAKSNDSENMSFVLFFIMIFEHLASPVGGAQEKLRRSPGGALNQPGGARRSPGGAQEEPRRSSGGALEDSRSPV